MTPSLTMLCCNAECRILFAIMLNIIMVSVIMLNGIMLSVLLASKVGAYPKNQILTGKCSNRTRKY
jgi:hypothetical protein